jgi:sulfur-oxidizing protein SoxX
MKFVKTILMASVIGSVMTVSSVANSDLVKKGEKVFMTKKLGNCLACHDVNGKSVDGPGSFGPKLMGLKYWDDQMLYDTVYDIYAARGLKVSPMPAFGTNGWLDDSEIKALVAYLKTIE